MAGVLAVTLLGSSVWADFIFEEPVNLGKTINPATEYGDGCLSADGLEMYFSSALPQDGQESVGGSDLWVVTRRSTAEPWGPAENAGLTINSPSHEIEPCLSADGRTLFFASDRPGTLGGLDIWMATRSPDKGASWYMPVNMGAQINSPYLDGGPCICETCLVLFFHSDRDGGLGGSDLYMAKRDMPCAGWNDAVNVGSPLNSFADEFLPSLSCDDCALYFCCMGRYPEMGVVDLWQTSICHMPIMDFNGDGTVTLKDLNALTHCWEAGECWADVAPGPFGDGEVDDDDVAMLVEHWLQQVEDPTLLAHWTLDETEGAVAYDSAGGNDATITGDPLWLPGGGAVDGALDLDGVDDLVASDFVVNPADGPFSAFAWVRGGQPGEGIICQRRGATWLAANEEGALMTELKGPGGTVRALHSSAVITDGDWHRVTLVCDGKYRILYVDESEVARDDRCQLQASEGGLVIGGALSLTPGTLWSGEVDDVRIYRRAAKM